MRFPPLFQRNTNILEPWNHRTARGVDALKFRDAGREVAERFGLETRRKGVVAEVEDVAKKEERIAIVVREV